MSQDRRTIRVGHSPDSDDAFMFHALANDKIDTGDLRFVHQLEDIETLNRRALHGELEVSAVSIHAYAYLADRYALLSSGSSMGDRYGPKLIARRPWTVEERFEVGLIIHEGQLYYPDRGLQEVLDLGVWWFEQTGLPLPLGGNVVRRDLGEETVTRIAALLKESIQYALDHREEALDYALRYARGLDPQLADRFVGMYVNEWTIDYGSRGRQAVRALLSRAEGEGLVPGPIDVQFVG